MPVNYIFKEGDFALLIDKKNKSHLITLKTGQRLYTSHGYIDHQDIIDKPDGSFIHSSKDRPYIAFIPTFKNYILKMSRGAQVIYPKDLAFLLMWADIFPGARVLEAGIGSGALTMALLRAVGENGKVISYEIRDDFAKIARKNINGFLCDVSNHEIKMRNIYENGIEEDNLDRIILDLSEPWQVIDSIIYTLRPGGIIAIYTPTIIQAEKSVRKIRETKRFRMIETHELLLRPWNIKGRSVRPEHRMVGHTAFITTARLIYENKNSM